MEGLLKLCSEEQFIIAPAAFSFSDLTSDEHYRESLESSDFAITDSALMVLLWKIIAKQSLPRISGLKLLRSLLDGPELKEKDASFWVMPSVREKEINLSWFHQHDFPIGNENCYVAPWYNKGPIIDPELLSVIEARKPRYVLINIGGGTQERVGFYLRKNLSYRPTILCVGAAIAFITGIQAHIPPWADAWGLGWLLRCFHAPRRFVPRYLGALELIPLLYKYRDHKVTDNKIA
jgi:UDP-N-acetyl-D-mannosaminuronic acid transferase (WecB/TagA/CpsF family)